MIGAGAGASALAPASGAGTDVTAAARRLRRRPTPWPAGAPVSIVGSTDIPGRTRVPSEGCSSSTIFTGTRCTTLVKLPVALSGGSSANVLPVPGDQAVHMAGEREVGKGVDSDASRLANPNVGHLGLLVVRDHPDVRERNDGDHLRADIDELAEPHLPLADQPIRGRQIRV